MSDHEMRGARPSLTVGDSVDQFVNQLPERPVWSVRLGAGSSLSFRMPGDAPSRFHRFMQRALLGIVWERNDG